mgnify:FL=1
MILLIDNYDSFSYNLVQLVGTIAPDIRVIRNDEMTVEQIEQLAPTHIILSPGPGRPSKAGVCEEVIKYFNGKVPILGVCLGHQAICEVYGATITYAKKLMHGKMSVAALDTECPVFAGMRDGRGRKISFADRSERNDTGMFAGHCYDGRWRSHGRET